MIKNICIITSYYPTKYNMANSVFVQQLVWAFAEMGINCTVICPIAANIDIMSGIKLPNRMIELTRKGYLITVNYPKYIGFGQQNLHFFNTASLTMETFSHTVKKVFKSMPQKPDIVYGHFITPAGITAARIGREFNIPAFLSYGESSPWSINNLGLKKVISELKTLSGVVSVSTKNKDELINLRIAESDKIGVFSNAIRADHFYPRDRVESRKKFCLPLDVFIVAFVGHFIKRKGIDKVIRAVESMDNIFAIFAGKGSISPKGKKTLFSGLVNPADLPYFYSTSDIFVLPTINEGCCNAIIEAMACGLPIISSDMSFNDDILDDTCSIRINPVKTNQIMNAIHNIYSSNKLREKLSQGALIKASKLTLQNRARNIIEFMESKIN